MFPVFTSFIKRFSRNFHNYYLTVTPEIPTKIFYISATFPRIVLKFPQIFILLFSYFQTFFRQNFSNYLKIFRFAGIEIPQFQNRTTRSFFFFTSGAIIIISSPFIFRIVLDNIISKGFLKKTKKNQGLYQTFVQDVKFCPYSFRPLFLQ